MELRPVPRRTTLTPRWYAVVAGVSVVPFLVMVIVPAVLDLHRFVLSSDAMGGSLSRGSLILAQQVPVGDLAAGDVISFVPPAPYNADGMVTRRVLSVGPRGATTASDSTNQIDPWTLPSVSGVVDRMVLHVPWIGYPFLGAVGRGAWALLVALPVAVVAFLLSRDLRRRRPPVEAPEQVRPVVGN